METSLFVLLIGLCIYLFQIENSFLLGVASALLLITRPEGIFVLAALAIEHFRLRRPLPSGKDFILPIVILANHFLFMRAYYGSLVSDTAMVKIIQGRSGLWGAWPPIARVGYQLKWFFDGRELWLVALLLLALIGMGASQRTPTATPESPRWRSAFSVGIRIAT